MWVPLIDPGDENILSYLTDLEIQKVKRLEDKWKQAAFKRDQKFIELEILRIYRDAYLRHESKEHHTLIDWLNEEERKEFEQIIKKADSSRSFDERLKYEVAGYRLVFESICRQTEFRFKDEVEKYINMLMQCETHREVEIITSIIRDLLAEA